jgi:hypothetical protein
MIIAELLYPYFQVFFLLCDSPQISCFPLITQSSAPMVMKRSLLLDIVMLLILDVIARVLQIAELLLMEL